MQDAALKMNFPAWQDYSQQELDAQYNQASLVSNVGEIIARQTEQASRFRDRFIAGGGQFQTREMADPRLTIDFFVPTGERPPAMILFVPGGAWLKGDSWESCHLLAEPVLAAGAGLGVLHVNTAHTHSLSQLADEAAAAMRWLAGEAALIGADPQRLMLAGHSSGAHLASLATVRLAKTDPGLNRHSFLISGMYDLAPVRASARNDYLHLDKADVPNLSAIASMPASLPAISLRVSSDELTEFRRQSAAYASALQEAGKQVDYSETDSCNHFTIIERVGPELGQLAAAL